MNADYAVDTILTGDIDYVGTMTTNFMTEVCETYVPQVSITLPLWQTTPKNRTQLLVEMIEEHGFVIVFSCVKEPLNASWIGRRLDRTAIRDLEALDIDITGENGEYHTMVLYVPSFYAYPLSLEEAIRSTPTQEEEEDATKNSCGFEIESEQRDSTHYSSRTRMVLELKNQPGQKERWWVCHPDTKLVKDTNSNK